MPTTASEIIQSLPDEQREFVEARTTALIAEELVRREIRRARKIAKIRTARKLHLPQKQILEIEQKTEMHFSVLRRTIESMGGTLSLVAQFPDTPPVQLAGLSED